MKWYNFFDKKPEQKVEVLLRIWKRFYLGCIDEELIETEEFCLNKEEIDDERSENGGRGIYWCDIDFSIKDVEGET